jgi:hypothetical protein
MFGKFEFMISSRKRIVFNLVIVFLAAAGLIGFINAYPIISWDFRNNLWGPTYLLVHGQSAYNIDALFKTGNAVWLPMAVGTFFPLGWLPLKQASNLWLVINVAGILGMIWVISRGKKPSVILSAVTTLAVFIFPPVVLHLWLGQFTIVATVIFLVVGIWHKKLPLLLSAFLMAIALSKPQLAVFFLPGLLLSIYKERGIKASILFICFLFLGVMVLTIPLFLSHFAWWPDFLVELWGNPTWQQPSIFALLPVHMGKWGLIIWAGVALVLFGVNIWLWLNLPNREAVFWSLALTPLVTPYVWSWDFVMLVPLFINSIFSFETKRAFWFLVVGYIFCWGAMVKTIYGKMFSDHLHWWVPWFLLITISVAHVMDKGAASTLLARRDMGESGE